MRWRGGTIIWSAEWVSHFIIIVFYFQKILRTIDKYRNARYIYQYVFFDLRIDSVWSTFHLVEIGDTYHLSLYCGSYKLYLCVCLSVCLSVCLYQFGGLLLGNN